MGQLLEELGFLFLPCILNSRLNRTHHLMFSFFWLVVFVLTYAFPPISGESAGFLALIALVNLIILKVKRFHDCDASGWWILALFVPGIGWLLGIAMYFIPGTKGANRFGEQDNRSFRLIGWLLLLSFMLILFALIYIVSTSP